MASVCKNLRLARHGASYISHPFGAMRTYSSNSPLLKTRPPLPVKSQAPSKARILGPRAFHTEINKEPPVHYLVEIDSFSRLEKLEIDKFETGVFESGGYNWKLKIYNDGDNAKNVPVKLALADTSALPENWELDAVFSISLKNQINGFYHSVKGRAHFDATNTEWGGFFPKYLLNNPAYGYILQDTCVFCADVFVNKNELVTENMSLKNLKRPPYKREFIIPNFPLIKEDLKEEGGWVTHQTWTSEEFSYGGHDWILKVSPNGWKKGTRRLSVYLVKVGVFDDFFDDHDSSDDDDDVDSSDDDLSDDDSSERSTIKTSFFLTLKSQNVDDHHVKYTCTLFFEWEGGQWGWRSFIDLASLNDPDKGFILNGCVHLELELNVEEENIISD